MITKENLVYAFGMAGSMSPARDRITELYRQSVDPSVIEGKNFDELAVDALVWYAKTAVNDEMVIHLNRKLQYYPCVEFLKQSLDEYTIFQTLVGLNGAHPERRVWKGQLIPALAGCKLAYLGNLPFDTKGDIYIGLNGKTTWYKYRYGEYCTYMTEKGKLVVAEETHIQDQEDKGNHLIIRSMIEDGMNYVSVNRLDELAEERFRDLNIEED